MGGKGESNADNVSTGFTLVNADIVNSIISVMAGFSVGICSVFIVAKIITLVI